VYLEHLALVAVKRVDTPTSGRRPGIPELHSAVLATRGHEGFMRVPLRGFYVPATMAVNERKREREGGKEGGRGL